MKTDSPPEARLEHQLSSWVILPTHALRLETEARTFSLWKIQRTLPLELSFGSGLSSDKC